MSTNPFESGRVLTIKVKPKSREDEIHFDTDPLLIEVRAPAHNNLANKAIVRLFKEALRLRVEIIRGHTSPIKQIKIL